MPVNRLVKLTLSFLLLSIAAAFASAQDSELPDLITVARPGFHPEGIEWDAGNSRFLTGSFTEGTIFEIFDDGTITPFIEDENLQSTLGIQIDHERSRLLVANSEQSGDSDSTGLAQLGIYDLNSGERLHFVDLGSLLEEGNHLANDVTVDAEGNAYVTDSFSPVIYKVTVDGEASILVQSAELVGDFFGLNGIEYHPEGYLLVARSEPGSLFKIPLEDPEAMVQIELDEAISPDGILLHPNGSLIVVAGTFNEDGSVNREVLELTSEDGWQTAEIANRAPTNPDFSASTVALRDEIPYVVYSHFNELFSGQQVDEFEIVRVDFEE